MNSDIRLSVGFWQHPKTFRLERQLGLKAIRSLQILWCWCAQNRPDGNLAGLDPSEIEFVADWRGKKGAFIQACIGNWLDETKEGFRLHEWADYNPYQAHAASREEARKEKASKAAKARWGKESEKDANGCSDDTQAYAKSDSSICSDDAQAYANGCSEQCSSICLEMPTCTSTRELKGNLNTPPIAPQGGPGMDSPKTHPVSLPEEIPDYEPSMEFVELRKTWDEHMRPEGPKAGFKAYLALKKAKAWPGLGTILEDIRIRTDLAAWNPGYEPGLDKYLSDRVWLAPMPQPRASPQKPKTFDELEEEQRQKRRKAAMEYDRQHEEAKSA